MHLNRQLHSTLIRDFTLSISCLVCLLRRISNPLIMETKNSPTKFSTEFRWNPLPEYFLFYFTPHIYWNFPYMCLAFNTWPSPDTCRLLEKILPIVTTFISSLGIFHRTNITSHSEIHGGNFGQSCRCVLVTETVTNHKCANSAFIYWRMFFFAASCLPTGGLEDTHASHSVQCGSYCS